MPTVAKHMGFIAGARVVSAAVWSDACASTATAQQPSGERSECTAELTVHLDQGWQYKMQPYRAMLTRRGVTQSMSRKGNCLDNAAIESFFGTLKAKYYHLATLDGIETLEAGVHDYIRYYNHERIKLGLQGLSPVEYRLKSMV